MTGTARNKRQKQVDILLAVDVMNHAARRNTSAVHLITGDQDFKPLVQALVDMGLYVTVRGDFRHTSMELAEAADYFEPLRLSTYLSWSRKTTQAILEPPSRDQRSRNYHGYELIASGTVGGEPAELYGGIERDFIFRLVTTDEDLNLHHRDQDLLLKYCQIEFGEVTLRNAST